MNDNEVVRVERTNQSSEAGELPVPPPPPSPLREGSIAEPRNDLQSSTGIIAGVVVAVAVVLFGGQAFRALTSEPPPATSPPVITVVMPTALAAVRETVIVTQTPAPTPACPAISAQLTLIASAEQAGDWQGAQRYAEDALRTPGLCPQQTSQLTASAVTNGLNIIKYGPFEGGNADQQRQAVRELYELRERARLAGVEFPPLLPLAAELNSTSRHVPAFSIIETAHKEGAFNPWIDRQTTTLTVSTLFNAGKWLTEKNDRTSPAFAEGLSYLVASHQLAVIYRTGQGEAVMLLKQLVGPEEGWPAPYDSPLLHASEVP